MTLSDETLPALVDLLNNARYADALNEWLEVEVERRVSVIRNAIKQADFNKASRAEGELCAMEGMLSRMRSDVLSALKTKTKSADYSSPSRKACRGKTASVARSEEQ